MSFTAPIESPARNPRSFISSLALLVCASAATAASAREVALTPEERAWLARNPVIRYGADPHWPPFSIRTRDRLTGIDRSLFDLLESRLGIRFEYVPTNQWPENLEKLKRGEIDLVSGIANLPERSADFLFTQPYASFPVAMIMRDDGPFFTSLEQIEENQLIVAAPEDYAPTIYLEKAHPSIPLRHTADSLEALRLVSSGDADAMVENLGVASHLIQAHALTNLKITGPTKLHFDPAVAVRSDLPELHQILEKTIDSITPQERYQVYQEWVLVEISGLWSSRKVITVCLIVLGCAALVIALISLWNRRLGHELAQRRLVEAALRESEERFRHLFETMTDACFVTGLDGLIQLSNGAAAALLGIGSRPAIGRLNLATFLREPGEFANLLNRLRESERLRDHPLEFTDADGGHHPCLCQIRLVKNVEGGETAIEWIARTSREA